MPQVKAPPVKPKNHKRLELSKQELAKVQKSRRRNEGVKIEPEWLFLSEFGFYYGWEGISAILNNEISQEAATALLMGARKIWNRRNFDTIQGMFVASLSAYRAKSPYDAFDKSTQSFKKAGW